MSNFFLRTSRAVSSCMHQFSAIMLRAKQGLRHSLTRDQKADHSKTESCFDEEGYFAVFSIFRFFIPAK